MNSKLKHSLIKEGIQSGGLITNIIHEDDDSIEFSKIRDYWANLQS